jgi:hypothetical protein
MSQRLWILQLGWLAVVIGLCLSLSGCGGSKVNRPNFDKIATNMPESEVIAILGQPTETKQIPNPGGVDPEPNAPQMKMLIWRDGTRLITVSIRDGKVTSSANEGF